MPVFRIRYTSPRTNHAIADELELVTEPDWDSERTHHWFKENHPNTTIIGFLTIGGTLQSAPSADGTP
jgi:hypothetical protein